MTPPSVQAKWDEIHAELQRRLEALHEKRAQGFELTVTIRGENGIPRGLTECVEKDRRQQHKTA